MLKQTQTCIRLLVLHFVLKTHGVQYGDRLRGNRCHIINKGQITIGDNVLLNSYPDGACFKTSLCTHLTDAAIRIGSNCNLNGTQLHSRRSIIIGDYCLFGPGAVILDNDSHNTSNDPIIRRTGSVGEAPVVIGSNVWVGMRSIIMKGVQVGNNAIIAAGSVVTADILPNSVYGGNPAKYIKALQQHTHQVPVRNFCR